MFLSTRFLRRPPIRVAGAFTLGRTMRLRDIAAVAAGGIFGGVFALIAWKLVGMPLPVVIFTIAGGGGLGFAAANWSPLRGESLSRFIALQAKARREGVIVRGTRRRVYLGVAPLVLDRPSRVRFVQAAVRVVQPPD